MDTQKPNGWTIATAMEHFKALLDASDKRHEQQTASALRVSETGFTQQREAVNTAFAAQKEAVNAALAAADRAVQKAESAAERRFESVNEFRGTLADQQRNLIPRAEVVVMLTAMTEKVDAVRKQMDTLQAERAGIKGGWGYAVGLIGLLLAVATVLLRFGVVK